MTTSNSKNADESDESNETSWLSTRAYERDSTAVIGSHPVDEKVLKRRAKRRRLGVIGRSIFSRVGQIVAVLLAIGVIGMAGLLAFSSDAQTQTSRSIQAFAAQRMTTCAQGYAGILNICVLFPTAELYARGDVDGIVGIKDSFIAYSEGSSTPPVDDALPRDGKATYTGYSKALTGGATSSGTATAKESDTLLKTPHTPQAPGGLRLAMRGTRELHARWHKVDGATQYRIKMWAKKGMRKGKERTVHTGSTEVNIPVFPEDTDEDENTDTETEYTVEVEPINPAGPGQKAESTTTTPPAAQTTTPPAPSTVKGVKAAVSSATGVDLSWDSADNATSYIVQRATNTAFSTDKKEYLVGNIQRYNINDLQTGVTYYFRVQASNKGVTGNWSSHASATTLLASPAWIEVTPSSRGVLVVQWSKSGAASEYEVQYSTASNFLLAPTKTVSSTSLTLTQLKDDTMYFVRVKAKGSQMSSDWSNSVAATTQQSPPAVPTGVKVTAGSGGTALVEWSAVDGATSYEIRYFSDNDATVTRHSSTTNVKLVNMSDATKYTVMVRAKNATGTSEWSSDTPLTTSTQPPAVPTGVTATVNSTTAITVKWNAVAGAERYSLVYSTSSSLTGSTSIANITATSRQVTGLKAGTTYYFAVIAHNAGGNVGSSATISAKTQTTTTPTPAPTPAPAPSTPTPAPAPSTPKEEVSTPAPAAKELKLDVLTYNVLGSTADNRVKKDGLPWSSSKATVLKTVKDSGADLIGLQEVHKTDGQMESLAQVNTATYSAVNTGGNGSDTYKNLMLYNKTKLTLGDKGTVSIFAEGKCDAPDKNNQCKVRHANWAILTHKDTGRKILFANTHLPSEDANPRKIATENLVKMLDDLKKKHQPHFVVVTGDFNSTYVGTSLSYPDGIMDKAGYVDSFALAAQKQNADYNSSNKLSTSLKEGKIIDKVYLTKGNSSVTSWKLTLNTVTVSGKTWPASDHWPVQSKTIFKY